MSTTPGRKFFDEHLAYLNKNDIAGLIDHQYTQDRCHCSDEHDRFPENLLRCQAP